MSASGNGLVRFGVKRPIVGSLLMWFLVIGGVYCLLNLRREFFPKVDPDAASISIIYPGASPAEVEESMARKIEDAVADLDGIKRITSNLAEGGGGIAVEFNDGRDMADALDDVRVAVDSLNDLPEEAERIRVTELQPNFPVIMLTLFGDASESALKQAARRVADELRSLPEMGSVVLTGTRDSEIRIDVNPVAMKRYGLRLSTVNDIVRSWMTELPGGTMRTTGANLGVRTMGVAERAETIREIPMRATTDGQVVRLADIATVTESFVDEQVARRFNGKPAASIIVFKKGDEDAVRIAEMVRGYVAGRRGDEYHAGSGWSALKSIVTGSDRWRGYELGQRMRERDPLPCDLQSHSDLARIIEGRLDLLTNDAWQGSLLVFVVMVLFMNARSAWWVMSGIFVSIGCTTLLMWMFDITLNLITMFGLLIVVGMLADDAIVVSDIILQRATKGRNAEEAAIEGTTSVFWPIVANASTVIVAFLPLAFVGGRIGDLLAMLPMVAAAALSSSVVETMIILPAHMAHSIHSMRGSRPGPIARTWARFEHWREDRLMPGIISLYTRVATAIVDNRYVATTATIAVLIVSLGMVGGGRVPFTFLPADDSETVIIDVRLPIGSTMEMTEELAGRFERAAKAQPEVFGVSSILGQSTNFETGQPNASATHIAQLYVELLPVETRDRHSTMVLASIREAAGDVSEAESVRFSEITGGPSGADITYEVRGEDKLAAREVAEELKLELMRIEGVDSIADDDFSTQRELRVELRPSAAALGFNVADVARQVRGILYGLEAHTYSADREDVKVRVRIDEASRKRVDSVADLWIAAPNGALLPLSEVATVTEGNSYAAVRRIDRERTITVTADCVGATNPELVTEKLAPALERLKSTHHSVQIREGGRQKDLAEAFASLPLAFMVALGGIYVILAWLFGNYTQPLAVMLAIPFGMIGVVWGHFVMGYQLTFLSMIGFVALTGIVVNNSLILVEFTNQAMNDEKRSLHDALLQAGSQRLRPIFLTTLTTLCGLIPLLMEQSFQARFLIPMGISIGGGLVSATMLTLLVLPANILIIDDLRRGLHYLWHGESPENRAVRLAELEHAT
ncbi:MAG: efflux RND transporter permease subunit [Phycisphaerae bacterium]|jgi:HAE1 family hydrophobic/amphiphilic exporter-1|nr:efflux RND transporter permease subunit [Phycisphaerae bacterium]